MGGSGNQRCFLRNKNGLAAMRHTLPTLFGYLISRRLPLCGLPAASVAINAAFPREGSPALGQSGAAPGAVPSVSAEWHAFVRPVASAGRLHSRATALTPVAFSYGQKRVVCVWAGVTCVGVEHSASSFASELTRLLTG